MEEQIPYDQISGISNETQLKQHIIHFREKAQSIISYQSSDSLSQQSFDNSSEEDRQENESKIEELCDEFVNLKDQALVAAITAKLKLSLVKLRILKKGVINEKMRALETLTNPLMDKEILFYQQFTSTIIKVQAVIRMKSQMKIYKLKLKRARYRNKIIKEMLHTEEAYVEFLNVLNENVLQKISKYLRDFPSDSQTMKILQDMIKSLNNIKTTNANILVVFQIRMLSLSFNFSFFKDFDTCFIPQFSAYFNYCQQFQSFTDTVKQVRSNNKAISDIISDAEKDHLFRGQDLLSIMVKPIQRLPKYILLLKDILKHTEDTHLDYKHVKLSLVKFEQINEENNSNMNKYIHTCKLMELDKLIVQNQEKKVTIIKEGREFMMEESLNILNDSSDSSVIAYFLSDLILLTETDGIQTNLLQYMEIDESSICKNIPDQKYFSYLFCIKGINHQMTFICSSKENKKYIDQKIQQKYCDVRKLVMNNRQSNDQTISNSSQALIPVQVSILGTEVRQMKEQYTIYIVEISVDQIKKRIYVRYSEIRDVKKLVEKEFGLTDLPKLSNLSFMTKQKTRVVETRKMIIEDVLQIIFNNIKIQEKGEVVLKFLGLPIDLFRALKVFIDTKVTEHCPVRNTYKPHDQELQKTQTMTVSTNYLLMLKNNQVQEISKKKQDNVRSSQSIINKGYSISKVQILLMDGVILNMEVDETTTGGQLILDVGYEIKLLRTLDFRLYIMEKNKSLKSLDSDVLIQKLVQEMIDSGYKFQRLQLQFRKYIFLSNTFEDQDFKEQPVRLRLIVFQILDDIRNFKYNLTFMQYCLIACVSIYLRKISIFPIKDTKQLLFDLVREQIPKKILLSHQEHVWKINIMKCFELLNKEIYIFIENKKDLQVKEEELILYTLYVVIMQRIRQNPMYGISTFQVEIYQQTLKDIKSTHKQTLPNHMVLGISLNGVGLYTQDHYQQKLFHTYSDILDVKVFPLSIIITFNKDSVNYRFNSNQSFNIDQLMKEFIQLNHQIKVFQEDHDLIK